MKSIGERIYPGNIESVEDYVLYLKHLFAYEYTKEKLNTGLEVLEVGCGEGYGTSILAQSESNIIGVDIDSITIDNANANYGSDNCKYKLYDGVKLPFTEEKFDVVVSFQVIEHVPDDVAFLAEIKRVLKVGGVLYLATPCSKYRLRPGQLPWNRFHLREYSHSEMSSLLSGLFNDFSIHGVSAIPFVNNIELSRVYPNKFKFPLSLAIKKILELKTFLSNTKKLALSEAMTELSVDNFFLLDSSDNECLDLFAVCKK